MTNETKISNFFKAYGETFDNGEKLSEFYSDCALASAPKFVGCLKGREELCKVLIQISEYQIKTGMTALVPLKIDTSEIDSLHCWSKVHWGARFKKTGDKTIEFDISYLLRINEKKFSILLYISHQDEQQLRQDLDLL